MQIFKNIFSSLFVTCIGFWSAGESLAGESYPVFSSCDFDGIVKRGCKVSPIVIAETGTYDMEFTLNYQLECSGHRVGFEVVSNRDFINISYSEQALIGRIEGLGKLVFKDANPDQTYRASFPGMCWLHINQVTQTPSFLTIETMTAKALDAADRLQDKISLYILAANYESYQEWDISKTQTMHDSIQLKRIHFEDLCESQSDATACRTALHLKVIESNLKYKLDNPHASLPMAGTQEQESLTEVYYQILADEQGKAEGIRSELNYLNIAVGESLTAALQQVSQITFEN